MVVEMSDWVTAGLMAPGREAARENTGLTQAEELHDEDHDMPQPESSEALTQRLACRRTTTKRVRVGTLSATPAISW